MSRGSGRSRSEGGEGTEGKNKWRQGSVATLNEHELDAPTRPLDSVQEDKTHLEEPTNDQHTDSKRSLLAPQDTRDLRPVFVVHLQFAEGNIPPRLGKRDHSRLGGRVGHPPTVVRDVEPPDEGEEEGVEG